MTDNIAIKNPDKGLVNKSDPTKSFLRLLGSQNKDLNNVDLRAINICINQDEVTAKELEDGFLAAYKDPTRYGKMQWRHVWKHILANRWKDKKGNENLINAPAYEIIE